MRFRKRHHRGGRSIMKGQALRRRRARRIHKYGVSRGGIRL